MTKSKIEELFDTMVSRSDGKKRRLPEQIDPGHKKKRRGGFKPIEFVCAPCEPGKVKSDCWVCVSHARGPSGHINYSTRDANGKPKGQGLHRIVFELAVDKKLPKDLFACHKCDVPWCINPAHIFPGTAKDNMEDMASKQRNLGGEKHPKAKLTDEQAWDIRTRHALGRETQKSLADEYGVGPMTIYNAVHFKTYRR